MRPDDDGDTLTITDHLEQTSAATVCRLLREALEIRFDDLIEFESGSSLGFDDDMRAKGALIAHMKNR